MGQPDAWYYSQGSQYSPVHPQYESIIDKKPSPLHLHQSMEELKSDSSERYFIGDRLSDMETAINGNAVPILVRTGFGIQEEIKVKERYKKCLVFDDLAQAVQHILKPPI